MKKMLLGVFALLSIVSATPAVAQYYLQPQPIILVPVYQPQWRLVAETRWELRNVHVGYDFNGWPLYGDRLVPVTHYVWRYY